MSTATCRRAADVADQRADPGLAGHVQAVERLVEDEQLGAADQGLGDQQPLLLAAGALPDRAPRVAAGPDEVDHLVQPSSPVRRPGGPQQPGQQRDRGAPPVPVQAEPDDVDPADADVGVEGVPLRQVPDRACCAGRAARPAPSTVPALTPISPRITFSRVDFPTPLGPSTATNSPAATSRDTSDHTVVPPTTADGAAHAGTAGLVGNRRWDGPLAGVAGDRCCVSPPGRGVQRGRPG